MCKYISLLACKHDPVNTRPYRHTTIGITSRIHMKSTHYSTARLSQLSTQLRDTESIQKIYPAQNFHLCFTVSMFNAKGVQHMALNYAYFIIQSGLKLSQMGFSN